MITGWLHVAFPIDHSSRIGEARRHATGLAAEMDWDEVDIGRLALVVTELGSNLLGHADRGRLLLAARPDIGEIEVLALDHGPGIPNLGQCMGDGFSTGGTPGTGLGAVRRLARSFDIHSSVPNGTVAVARLRAQRTPLPLRSAAVVEIGAVSLAAPGETASGDGWTGCVDDGRAAVMLADGLGHGPEAARAAQAAMAVFRSDPFGDQRATLEEAHRQLKATRGAAISAVQVESDGGTLLSVGAGNVTVRIVSGDSDRSVLAQHGTVGLQIRRLEEVASRWPEHAVVVLHTDGIETRWTPQAIHPLLDHDPALVAAILLRDHCRGRDDATVVVIRRKG